MNSVRAKLEALGRKKKKKGGKYYDQARIRLEAMDNGKKYSK